MWRIEFILSQDKGCVYVREREQERGEDGEDGGGD